MALREFWDSLDAGVQVLAQVGGAIALIGTIWAVLKRPLRELWDNVSYMYNARAVQNEMLSALEEIREQMKPNGGDSIRDSLNRIEQKQEFAQSFLKTQLNAHHKALFECDADGRCVWVNRPHVALTGRSFDQMRGLGWVNVVVPDERDKVMDKWQHAIVEQREFDENVTYQLGDGTRVPVHINAYVIRHEETGKVLGYLGEVSPLAQAPEEIPISTRNTR